MSKTVEVPVEWLKRLIELGQKAEVAVFVNPMTSETHINRDKLTLLKGYIESAKALLKEGK